MEVDEYKSSTFQEIVYTAENYIPTHPFDVIYIAGGATNITTKDRKTKQISYRWGRDQGLQNQLTSMLQSANKRFKEIFLATKIIFCPLVGLELERVVTEHSVSQEDQEIVNDAVWEFNSQVFKINEERKSYCPALQQQVHRFCKGKRRNCYYHLHDGIHPNNSLKEKWAHHFVKAIAHN